MSIEIMTLVWKTDIGPATRRLVLLALADAANDEGVCWPSMETVARKAGCGVSTARRACQELEQDGYLAREKRSDKGRQRSNIYRLDVSALRRSAEGAQIERAPDLSGGGRSNRAGGPAQIERQNRKSEPKEEPAPQGNDGDAVADGALFQVPASEPDPEPPAFTAKDAVGAYVDAFRAEHQGRDPIGRAIRQVGAEAKRLIADGQPEEVIRLAAAQLGATPYTSLERQVMLVLAGRPGGGASWGRGAVDEFGRAPLDATRMSQEAERTRRAEEAAGTVNGSVGIYDDEFYARLNESGPAF